MGDLMCPIECVRVGCPEADFLQRNGAWLLAVIAGVTGCIGMLLTYFLKSRCSKIECCGMNCVRDVVQLKPDTVELRSSKSGL